MYHCLPITGPRDRPLLYEQKLHSKLQCSDDTKTAMYCVIILTISVSYKYDNVRSATHYLYMTIKYHSSNLPEHINFQSNLFLLILCKAIKHDDWKVLPIRVWSVHLSDLHNLDSCQLASLHMSPLVNLAIGSIPHHLNQLKDTSWVLRGGTQKVWLKSTVIITDWYKEVGKEDDSQTVDYNVLWFHWAWPNLVSSPTYFHNIGLNHSTHVYRPYYLTSLFQLKQHTIESAKL